jgi:hypothetical protein
VSWGGSFANQRHSKSESIKNEAYLRTADHSDHIMVLEDFERLYKFLLESEGLSEVSDDMRKLVEAGMAGAGA